MKTLAHHLPHGGGHQYPNRVVVHSMAEFPLDEHGTMYYAPDLLDHLRLSVHAMVTPTGDIIRCRHDDEVAHHAAGFNLNSLGVEFLVHGEYDYVGYLAAIKTDWVTTAQYQAGIELVRNWYHHHDIQRIDRHSDLSPGRKFDPGPGFNWDWFLSEI